MKLSLGLLLAATLLLPSPRLIQAQTPAPQDDEEVVNIRSQEVKLDVVVKDKRGRPIKDLKETDFEVYEDGVRQQIRSFRFVTRAGGATPEPERKENRDATSPPPATLPGTTTPGVTALVFDRLSPEARNLARKAGLAYAQEGMAGGDFTGVFGIDLSLRTIQSFTDDPALIKQAIEHVTGAANSTYVSGASRVRQMGERGVALDRQAEAAQSAAGPTGPGQGAPVDGATMGAIATEQKFIEMETSMIEQYQELERDQQGFATINSLLAVINPMQRMPGRKTLIFFSEGLALPASVMMKFPSVISAANRANVSIYAIDAAGLRIESGTAEAARELNSLAARRMQQVGRGTDTASGPYMKALEKNEDLLRLDPRSGLGILANETGGFLIHDTNDLSAGLRRINDDTRGYYLLTYVPQNPDFNGRFRQINVKLGRSNVEVQTRKGYYAVESAGQFPVLDYEAPALAAAQHARAKPNPFSFRAGALSFPAPGRPGLALVLAEAPLSAFTFGSKDKKTYNADFAVVALIKNQSGQVVQKLSQHYPLSGPFEKLEGAKQGELLFYRETQLPPGSYTVELVGYDAAADKASVRTSRLEIPGADESRPRLSSVSVLKRGERLSAEEQKRDQPFQFGELLVYPNLGEPIPRAAAKQLAFFFTAWPAKGSTDALQLTLEILQNGRSLGQTSAPLPAADQQGQIKYASSFPLDKFQPGTYDLKVTIGDGKSSVSRSTGFTVAP
ncbi:MAG: VWA domain-containing protein [Pyrinomonadaceae bacterium]